MKKGQCARHDSSYERHGTQCLIANFEVATGKIISPTIGDSRTEEDFISHIKNTVKTDPKAEWIIILDQLNTHKSESLVRYVAQACNIEVDLGIKGKISAFIEYFNATMAKAFKWTYNGRPLKS